MNFRRSVLFLLSSQDTIYSEMGGTEGVTKIGVVKMFNRTPRSIVTSTTLRNETMNVRVPLKTSTKRMKYTNDTRYKLS